jgi:predicted transcriptional regulator
LQHKIRYDRNYAAPEIINKVRPRNHREENKEKEKAEQKRSTTKIIATATSATSSHGTTATATATATNTNTNTVMTTETISNYVADYGLLVDSYSMGHTIRYMMTGVQPGTSIDDAIQKQQNIENGLLCCRKLLFCSSNKNKKQPQPQKRSVRYRQTEDLPGEVYILIRSLTELSQRNRISIRKARRTVPWISDVFLSSSSQQQQEQQLSLSLSNKEDDNSNNNSNNDDDERKKEQPQNIISTLPTTTTTTISTPSSHYAVSEEQLHSLNQICYLSLGSTAAIEIVAAASNHPTTSPTKLDTNSDTSINTNTHTNTSTDKTSIVQIDTDDITTTKQTIVEQQHDETLMF